MSTEREKVVAGLNPCPFCGSEDLQHFHEITMPAVHFVYCCACEMHGPEERTIEGAEAAWNQRFALLQPSEPVGYITDGDLKRIQGNASDVPNVNVWADCGIGDHALYLNPPNREREAIRPVRPCPGGAIHDWRQATFHNVKETEEVGRPPDMTCGKCMMSAWLVTTPNENAILGGQEDER